MKIYLDYIFLENLVVNVIIFLETIKLVKVRVKLNKLILFSGVNAVISCLCIFFNLNSYIISLSITIFSLFLCIRENNIIKVLKATIIYYLIYYLFLGIVVFFSISFGYNLETFLNKIAIYVFSGIILNILTDNLWKMWKTKITYNSLYYYLNINNTKILAFVDTGNTVKDPLTNLDVIFIDEKYKNIIITDENIKKVKILVNSINVQSYIDGYIVNNIEVYKENKQVAKIDKIIISFNLNKTQEKYSGIIGYDTYLEYLEGVVL